MLGSLPVKHEKSSMDKFFSYSDSIIRFYFMCQNHKKIKLIRTLLFSIGHAAIHTSGFTPLIKYGYIYYLGMVEF